MMRLMMVSMLATLLLFPAVGRTDQPIVDSADLAEYDGFEGFWLRNDALEGFVALRPRFRILSLRRIGQPSLLAGAGVHHQGVRLAFMEGEQIPASFDVGNVPADILQRSAASAALQLKPAAGLQYTVTLRLAEDRPALAMKTSLRNVSDTPRRIAPWTVLAFSRDGTIVVPFGDQPRMRRRIVLPWWSAWPQPSVQFGRDTLVVDAAGKLSGTAYKVGVITEPGWITLVRHTQALLLHVPFDPQATYPEDGANITLFAAEDDASNWCEIEQVGPSVELAPGDATEMRQALELLTVSPPDEPSPDAWRQAVERVFNAESTSR